MPNKISGYGLTLRFLREDFSSGLVVFFVALPLCLGIAVASGASPFAGVISGIIGGVIVGLLSGSHVSVTGPAAGLIAILLSAIVSLGYEAFLLSVVLAGVFQLVMGYARAGTISNYFPSAVIEGMLAAIGIIIIKKEIPHAIGYDHSHEGDFFNLELGAEGYLQELENAVNFAHPGVIAVSLISLVVLVFLPRLSFLKSIRFIPAALWVVVIGILLNEWMIQSGAHWLISEEHRVMLPVPDSIAGFLTQFHFPAFSAITNPQVWITALTIAIVASVETLLCLEAGDKLDVHKRYSQPNQELKAQGIGNMLSGLLGGLPMTSVIVRTTANINAGAKSKLSAVIHGVFLLVAVLLIPVLLNKIPMACLAAILIMTGFRLASPAVFKHMWDSGREQFIPFMVTVLAVVFTDLLKGVGIGLMVSIFFILKGNMKLAYYFRKEKHRDGETITIKLAQEVSFLNKAAIKQTLAHLPHGSHVIIDAGDTVYIDYDVLELIRDFTRVGAIERNIKLELKQFKENYSMQDAVHVQSA